MKDNDRLFAMRERAEKTVALIKQMNDTFKTSFDENMILAIMASNYDSFWEGWNWNPSHLDEKDDMPVCWDLCRDASDDSIWVRTPPFEEVFITLTSQKPREDDDKRRVSIKDFPLVYHLI